jgi:hypothetical protein
MYCYLRGAQCRGRELWRSYGIAGGAGSFDNMWLSLILMKQVEVRGPAEVRRPDVASINDAVGDFEKT